MDNLIRADAPVTTDDWILLPREHGGPLPDGDVVVPLSRWLGERAELLARTGRTGVWLDSDEQAESLEGRLDGLSIVALRFPAFTDGRSYSNARILRERLGWSGELRAFGDVLRDQLFLMRRCGFDSFALRADRAADAALDGLRDFRRVYQQATVDPGSPLLWRRPG